MKVTILGCGAATGTPGIGIGWGACDPQEPRNRRRRASILVENSGTCVLVDTSPDLREQLLSAGVGRLDGVLFTHGHADHLHGIDDLRAINRTMKAAIRCWMDAETLREAKERFGYIFEPLAHGTEFHYKPTLDARVIEPGQPFTVQSISVLPFAQDHGGMTTLGFRFNSIAYSTDVVNLDEAAFTALAGIDTWIADCLTLSEHATHADLDKALAWIKRLRPRRAILTHMGVGLDYRTLAARLPAGVEPAYDGMEIIV